MELVGDVGFQKSTPYLRFGFIENGVVNLIGKEQDFELTRKRAGFLVRKLPFSNSTIFIYPRNVKGDKKRVYFEDEFYSFNSATNSLDKVDFSYLNEFRKGSKSKIQKIEFVGMNSQRNFAILKVRLDGGKLHYMYLLEKDSSRVFKI